MGTRMLVLVLLSVFALTASALAQDSATTDMEGFGEVVLANLVDCTKELGITQPQKKQMCAVVVAAFAEGKQVAKSDLRQADKIASILALVDTARQDLLSQLTSEQLSKLERIPAAQLLMNPGEALPQMIADFDFTADQQVEAVFIALSAKERAVAIGKDASLTDAARKAQWTELAKDTLQRAFSLLTAEQKQKIISALRYGG